MHDFQLVHFKFFLPLGIALISGLIDLEFPFIFSALIVLMDFLNTGTCIRLSGREECHVELFQMDFMANV